MKHHVLLAMLAAILCLAAGAAKAAESKIVSAVALTEILDRATAAAEYITSVRIEYPAPVKATDILYDTTYKVAGYDVIGSYVNNDGVTDHAEQQGRYVFLKFAQPLPGSKDGVTQHRYGAINFFWPGDVTVRQYTVLTLTDGTVVNPASITVANTVNEIADDCLDLAFVDSTGFKVTYRLFVPKGYESKTADRKNLPLVVYWHGGDSPGTSNNPQIREGIPAVLMRPDVQRDTPAFVMVPQSVFTVNPGPGVWVQNIGTKEAPLFGPTQSLSASIEAISDVAGKYNIDTSRIYGTGHSQGARALFMTSILKPDLLAAQIGVSSSDIYPDDQVKPMVGKPTWILVAENDRPDRPGQTGMLVDQLERLGATVNRKIGNDGFNGFLRGYPAELQAQAQIDEAGARGAKILYTHFIANTVVPVPHYVLPAIIENKAIRNWMFAQTLSR